MARHFQKILKFNNVKESFLKAKCCVFYGYLISDMPIDALGSVIFNRSAIVGAISIV